MKDPVFEQIVTTKGGYGFVLAKNDKRKALKAAADNDAWIAADADWKAIDE